GKWSGATAYNRGQVLYRVAEVMEGRHEQFSTEVAAGEGLSASKARAAVDAAIDRWVWYAGWTDKLASVLGGANPVAGPYFDFSLPEPTGVVAVLAPQRSSLLGLVSVLAPVLACGNTSVVVSSHRRPLPAVTLAEVLATSDVPGGVVNLLTGSAAELGPWLAAHRDVNAIDLTGAEPELGVELERSAADNVKRVLPAPPGEPDWTPGPAGRLLRGEVVGGLARRPADLPYGVGGLLRGQVHRAELRARRERDLQRHDRLPQLGQHHEALGQHVEQRRGAGPLRQAGHP